MFSLYPKNSFELWKTNNSINDYKWRKRRLALSCGKKTVYIIEKSDIKHPGDFYCLNCFYSFRTENFKFHEKVCRHKFFCRILIPSEKNKILEFNHYNKSDKMAYIISADMKSLIKNLDWCANNPENPPEIKIGEHILCGYSMSKIWAFDHIDSKHALYRGKH